MDDKNKISNGDIALFIIGSVVISYAIWKANQRDKELGIILAIFSTGIMIRGLNIEKLKSTL